MTALKSFLINIITVLVTVIICLVLVETALRFTKYDDIPKALYGYPKGYFMASEAQGYDITPNEKNKTHFFQDFSYPIFSNKYGCFDYEREVPNDYTLILGDSYTWGFAPLEEKWTTKLEEKTGHFALKCGVTGYGTKQAFQKSQQVIKEVGKAPKYIILMYVFNDFNDDFLIPEKTIYEGYIVSTIDYVNFQTGEITRRSQSHIERTYAKYKSDSVASHIRNYTKDLVLYRLYKEVEPKILGTIYGWKAKFLPKKPGDASETTAKAYEMMLSNKLDDDNAPWYDKALASHIDNLETVAKYAQSVGAKLLIVDTTGKLEHKKFAPLRDYFAKDPSHLFIYDLKADYKNEKNWKYDSHWNIEGNHEAAQYIYDYIQKNKFYDK